MKVVIRTQVSAKPQLTISTVPLRWDIAQRRFTMLRAIGDGFYDTPLETNIVPLALDIRDNELHIIVPSASDVANLAQALGDLSTYCFESYSHSRT